MLKIQIVAATIFAVAAVAPILYGHIGVVPLGISIFIVLAACALLVQFLEKNEK